MNSTLRRLKSQKGFTLIELLGVGAIIAILALVAIPTITGAINSSKVNAATETASVIRNSLIRYYAATVDGGSNGAFPKAAAVVSGDSAFTAVTGANSAAWATGYWSTPANPNYTALTYKTDADGQNFVLCLKAKDSSTTQIRVSNVDAPKKGATDAECGTPGSIALTPQS